MAILDNIIRKTEEVGKAIVSAAGDAYGYTKAGLSVASLENKRKDILHKIGKYMLDVELGNQRDDQYLQDLLFEAKELTHQISLAKERQAEFKDQSICAACGKKCDKDAIFCSHCGARFE